MKASQILKASEEDIERAILLYLEVRRILSWKNGTAGYFDQKKGYFRKPKSRFQIRGTSDILGVFKERFLAIEVKSEDGALTPEQLSFLQSILHAGGLAGVARSIEEARFILSEDIPYAEARQNLLDRLSQEKVRSK